jgi:hypothetical protein
VSIFFYDSWYVWTRAWKRIHHCPLIPLCGVGTTCFLLPFSSITRHLHAHFFYFHVILHTIYPSLPRALKRITIVKNKNNSWKNVYAILYARLLKMGIIYFLILLNVFTLTNVCFLSLAKNCSPHHTNISNTDY